jgi:hypothetical protein
MGVDRARWPLRTSTPLRLVYGAGGFDSLALPPSRMGAQDRVHRIKKLDIETPPKGGVSFFALQYRIESA